MNTKILLFPILVLSALLLGGCATPAQSGAMMPTAMGSVTKHPGTLVINVDGGSETSAAGASQISNKDFAAALEQSIQQSGLFSQVIPFGQASDYNLDVQIVRLQQPMMGFSMTATLETNWTLTRLSDKSVVWRKAVVSSHTAKTGEAFAGTTRLRLATEGAARNNIQDAIAQMSALTLP
jgi:hypothetical protein